MQLEDYFDFQAPNDIRIKGHRIGIETVLYDYLDGITPEEIVLRYSTLNLEKVYATITYYWRNQAEIDAYLKAAEDHERQMREAQARNPSPAVKRLYKLIEARHQAASPKIEHHTTYDRSLLFAGRAC